MSRIAFFCIPAHGHTNPTLAMDEALLEEIKKWKPDCIVADSMAIWGKLIAQKLKIPFVSSTTTFAFNQQSSKVMQGSIKDLFKVIWQMGKAKKHLRRLQEKGYPIKNVLDIIHNDNETHTIVYTSPEFQPCAETFSDKYVFVGPSIRPITSELEKTREKLIYISMGTVNNDMLPFYKNCIHALKDTDYQVILSVGNQISLDELSALIKLEDIRADISIVPFIDQIAVLEKTDVFLTHCGMNSVSEALYYEVPLVMFPQTNEQKGVAFRVDELGAGVYLKDTSVERIKEAFSTVIVDSAYKKQAKEISEGFKKCGGSKASVEKILSVI